METLHSADTGYSVFVSRTRRCQNERLLARSVRTELSSLLEPGGHHEQQHQELLLTDVLQWLEGFGRTTQLNLRKNQQTGGYEVGEFDTIFCVGGHGPMWDLVDNKVSVALIESFYNAGKPVATVCLPSGCSINSLSGNATDQREAR